MSVSSVFHFLQNFFAYLRTVTIQFFYNQQQLCSSRQNLKPCKIDKENKLRNTFPYAYGFEFHVPAVKSKVEKSNINCFCIATRCESEIPLKKILYKNTSIQIRIYLADIVPNHPGFIKGKFITQLSLVSPIIGPIFPHKYFVEGSYFGFCITF